MRPDQTYGEMRPIADGGQISADFLNRIVQQVIRQIAAGKGIKIDRVGNQVVINATED